MRLSTTDSPGPSGRDVIIRAAVTEDAPVVAEVHLSSTRWAYRDLLPIEAIEGRTVENREAMWRESFAGRFARVGGLVAERRGGSIVGFVAYGPASSEHEAAPDGSGEVFALYVLEQAAGRGIGRRLLEAAQEVLQRNGHNRAVLWVLTTNVRARAFYERAGWIADGAIGTSSLGDAEVPVIRYSVTW